MPDPISTSIAIDFVRAALQRSRAAVDIKNKPDIQDKEEDSQAREAAAKVRSLEEDNEDKGSFRLLRERYAKWVFGYLVGYSLFCVSIVIADGIKLKGFDLPDSVLEYLVGSTAAAAIGLVLAVTHGLFKR